MRSVKNRRPIIRKTRKIKNKGNSKGNGNLKGDVVKRRKTRKIRGKKTKTVMRGGANDVDFEKTSISKISFVPTNDEVLALIAQANNAENVRDGLATGSTINTPWRNVKLLSKLYNLPGKFGLCPDSLDPNDTILAKLGRGDIGPGGLGLGTSSLRVINDRNMPLGSTSCGPNGVLVECQGEYGPNRMNLFYGDLEKTTRLLNDYIKFRNDNLDAIFEMYVKKINASAETMKLDPSKEAQLDEKLQDDYRNVAAMFSRILDTNLSLAQCGISVNSFCQTWLRNGSKVGDAQFSVMSPHFQTRFFISDIDALKSCGVNDAQIASYKNIIAHFDEIMSKDYGVGGGGPAFINLDGLQERLDHQNNASMKSFQEKQGMFSQA